MLIDGSLAFSAAMNTRRSLPGWQDVLLGAEGRSSREQITLHLQHAVLATEPDQLLTFGLRETGAFTGLDGVFREPVPQTRLGDLQIPSQRRDRVLAVAVII